MARIHAFYNNEVPWNISAPVSSFNLVLILKGELPQTFIHTLGGNTAVSLCILHAGKCEF